MWSSEEYLKLMQLTHQVSKTPVYLHLRRCKNAISAIIHGFSLMNAGIKKYIDIKNHAPSLRHKTTVSRWGLQWKSYNYVLMPRVNCRSFLETALNVFTIAVTLIITVLVEFIKKNPMRSMTKVVVDWIIPCSANNGWRLCRFWMNCANSMGLGRILRVWYPPNNF